jgi:hypothetical protein
MSAIAGISFRNSRKPWPKAEVIRTGICPEHGVHTGDFCGANEHGWVFKCTGVPFDPGASWFPDIKPRALRKGDRKSKPVGHLFVNPEPGQ